MTLAPSTLDRVFAALADPSRRALVERLGRGPASVSQLAQPLDMSLAAVLQHLQVLEESGVILSKKRGRVRTCRLRPQALGSAGQWLARQQERFWKAGLQAMDRALRDEGGAAHQEES